MMELGVVEGGLGVMHRCQFGSSDFQGKSLGGVRQVVVVSVPTAAALENPGLDSESLESGWQDRENTVVNWRRIESGVGCVG